MSARSAADRIREKAQRLKDQQQPTGPVGDVEGQAPIPRALPAVPTVHTKPVRSTVDLAPMRHAALKAWCGETAVMIGQSRVTTQDVMRAMVDRLLTDETFARKIRDDLRADRS